MNAPVADLHRFGHNAKMAGPAVLILTPLKLPAARQEVEMLVSALSGGLGNAGKHRDFHIAGRPFFMWFGSETTDAEVEPDPLRDVQVGFTPQGQVGLAAMCNQTVDHILLAMLACRLSTILDGVIWLDGQLRLDGIPEGIAGLTRIGPHSHVVTAKFIYHWIESPSFRLPK